MSISELGSLGEFLGAIAVFATLLFLAMQIRHANRTADDTAVVLRSQSMREILLMLGGDAELASLYQRWLGADEAVVERAFAAEDPGVIRFGNLCLAALVTLQSSWLTDRSAKGRRLTRSRLLSQFRQPGVRAVWALFRDVHFYDEFRAEADRMIAEIRAEEGARPPAEPASDRDRAA